MKLQEAQNEYPDAWLVIQQRMDEVVKLTDAAFIPVAAAVVTDKGRRVLRVVCHTDLVESGSEADSGMFAFQAGLDGAPSDVGASVH